MPASHRRAGRRRLAEPWHAIGAAESMGMEPGAGGGGGAGPWAVRGTSAQRAAGRCQGESCQPKQRRGPPWAGGPAASERPPLRPGEQQHTVHGSVGSMTPHGSLRSLRSEGKMAPASHMPHHDENLACLPNPSAHIPERSALSGDRLRRWHTLREPPQGLLPLCGSLLPLRARAGPPPVRSPRPALQVFRENPPGAQGTFPPSDSCLLTHLPPAPRRSPASSESSGGPHPLRVPPAACPQQPLTHTTVGLLYGPPDQDCDQTDPERSSMLLSQLHSGVPEGTPTGSICVTASRPAQTEWHPVAPVPRRAESSPEQSRVQPLAPGPHSSCLKIHTHRACLLEGRPCRSSHRGTGRKSSSDPLVSAR
ncbi:unnamed protein product [Gadus morhua 'NCC']